MSDRQVWHQAPRERVHEEVFRTAEHIRREQYTARRWTLAYLEMYASGNASGLGLRSISEGLRHYFTGRPVGNGYGTSFNMSAAVCDTAASMVSQQPPLPIYATSGTNLKTARKADKKTKALQSQMNSIGKSVFAQAFDMAAQTGTGVVHVFLDEQGLPSAESVNPLEILVDHLDGYYRKPRSIHRVKYVSKEWLKSQHETRADVIDSSSITTMDAITNYLLPTTYSDHSQIVEVIDSWHLPSGDKAGRYTRCVSEGYLVDEPFEDPGFPFAFGRYRVRPFGFWGMGLIESVAPNQKRVNQLIEKVARAQDLASNLYIFSPDNGEGNVNPDFITTKIATIIPFDPLIGPPQMAKWDGTLGDLQEQIDLEFARVLRVEGISDTQVNGEVARGMTSGVAVRAADSVQSRRLYHVIERFEEMCLETAKLVERLNDRLAAEREGYQVSGFLSNAGLNFLVSSDWADLMFDEGEAFLNMMKMNALPTTPEGKWAAAQEWIEAGFVIKPVAMKLLEFPALDEYASLTTAAFDLVIKQITDMLDGVPTLPLPFQSMQLCLDLGTMARNRLHLMEHDPEIDDLFEEYLATARQKRAEAQPQQTSVGQPATPDATTVPVPAAA